MKRKYLTFPKVLSLSIILAVAQVLIIVSCVKENKPPDCVKPAPPEVISSIKANDRDTIHLSAKGISGATYSWSGPNGFYSTKANPVIINAGINENGKYYARTQVGYCTSDSVATDVYVKTDTTCRLGNNGAGFPNGSRGFFTVFPVFSSDANGRYIISASNADSTLLIDAAIKSKPSQSAVFTLTDQPYPGDNQVYFKIKDTQLNANFFAKGSRAYIKYSNGKLNLVICQVNFSPLGIFSANILCQ